MIKHTKGPWKVLTRKSFDPNYGELGRVTSVAIGDEIIDIAGCGYANTKYDEYRKMVENAKLIAAAPTMYEGLQAIFELANDNKSNPHELLAKISQIAEAGIKEVEGK